jgi:hypothetical protein
MSTGTFDSPHIHDDDLHLYIFNRLGISESEALERHLLDCAECTERLNKAAHFAVKILTLQRAVAEPNMRAEPRFNSTDCGFLRSLSPLRPEPLPVRIVDVSRTGLGLIAPVQLAPGTLVQVRVGRTVAFGEVVYTKRLSEQEFRVGLRLQDVLWCRE